MQHSPSLQIIKKKQKKIAKNTVRSSADKTRAQSLARSPPGLKVKLNLSADGNFSVCSKSSNTSKIKTPIHQKNNIYDQEYITKKRLEEIFGEDDISSPPTVNNPKDSEHRERGYYKF